MLYTCRKRCCFLCRDWTLQHTRILCKLATLHCRFGVRTSTTTLAGLSAQGPQTYNKTIVAITCDCLLLSTLTPCCIFVAGAAASSAPSSVGTGTVSVVTVYNGQDNSIMLNYIAVNKIHTLTTPTLEGLSWLALGLWLGPFWLQLSELTGFSGLGPQTYNTTIVPQHNNCCRSMRLFAVKYLDPLLYPRSRSRLA